MNTYKKFVNTNNDTELIFNIDIYNVNSNDIHNKPLTNKGHEIEEFAINLDLAMDVYDFEHIGTEVDDTDTYCKICFIFGRNIEPINTIIINLILHYENTTLENDIVLDKHYKENIEYNNKHNCNIDYIFDKIKYNVYDHLLNKLYDIMECWSDNVRS